MKLFLTLIAFLVTTASFAQNDPFQVEKCTAVIKGNVKNSSEKFWEFNITGYFNLSDISVTVDEKGNFSKTIAFDGDAQDIYLHLNNEFFPIDVRKNDTIAINWDAADFTHTFQVKCNDAARNNELQTILTIDKLYRQRSRDLNQLLYDKSSDSVKYAKINALYNQEVETIGNNKAMNSKLMNDTYFKYAELLLEHRLLSNYDLVITDTAYKKYMSGFQALRGVKRYQVQSEEAFKSSFAYRNFLFNYVRFFKPLNGWGLMGNPEENKQKTVPFSPSWSDYYSALASISVYQLRDWFITKSIMFDFGYYSFDDAVDVYKDFIPKIKVKAYADSLIALYKNAQTLKPGNIAPDLTLQDADGKPVSLKDLRGKVVYIDFWGIACGACIEDIKNAVPQLHEKYKDKNIVFVNICVDGNASSWKASLASLKLTGINLLAEGWTKNPVCKIYNVNGIPHYYLIDADGKIVDNNSPRPSDGDRLYAKLDGLLGKK